MNNLALTLKALRKERNLSQSKLAEKLCITQEAYSRYETGDREPNINTLIKLSDIFNVPIDILVGKYSNLIKTDKVVRSKKIINGKEKTVLSFRSKDYIGPEN